MGIQFSRRSFLGGCAVLGASSALPAWATSVARKPNLKMGVVSDIHVLQDRPGCDAAIFRRALEFYREQGVDAVMLAGDMSDWGKLSDLKYVADTWYAVFPDDRLPDGRHVEKLFIYGNHDLNGEGKADLHDNMIAKDKAAAWETCFREKFEPVWIKDVRGYKVIGGHWGYERDVKLDAFLQAHAAELSGTKPFFFTQHAHPKDTCLGGWAWGHDDGASTAALAKFPNAVAFSGHSHYTLVDERTVWQGAFTSVNTSSLRYSSTDYNLRDGMPGNDYGYRGWNRPNVSAGADHTRYGQQGMLVEVYDEAMVLKRYAFPSVLSLGPDWVVPIPNDGSFAFAPRAAKRAAPAFAANAKLAVAKRTDEKLGELLDVVIPPADAVDGCRPYELEVTVTLLADDVDLVVAQKRLLAQGFNFPVAEPAAPTVCSFKAADLPQKARLRFDVRPIECFGRKGAPIFVIIDGDGKTVAG